MSGGSWDSGLGAADCLAISCLRSQQCHQAGAFLEHNKASMQSAVRCYLQQDKRMHAMSSHTGAHCLLSS